MHTYLVRVRTEISPVIQVAVRKFFGYSYSSFDYFVLYMYAQKDRQTPCTLSLCLFNSVLLDTQKDKIDKYCNLFGSH
jgi:hypothetical protein